MDNRSVDAVQERFDQGAFRAAVLVMALWHGAVVLPNSVVGWSGEYVHAVWGLAVWVLYSVIGAVAATIILRGGGRGARLALITLPMLLAGEVVAVLAGPRVSFFDQYIWPFNTIGWFALVILWKRRPGELFAFFAVHEIIGLWLLIVIGDIGADDVSGFVMYAYGSCVIQITLFVGGRSLAMIARRTAETQDEAARVATRRLAAEAVQKSRTRRYEMVQRTVTEFLDSLAAGRLDLADPATQQRLRVAVTRLRRLTVETDDVPDPLLQELRACADEAERRGVEVDLQASVGEVPPLPVEVRRGLAEPVIDALAATSKWARVTVVTSPGEVAVAVVADAHLSRPTWQPRGTVQTSYDTEGELLWAEARWIAPSPSRS
jgi:hypothetical protein